MSRCGTLAGRWRSVVGAGEEGGLMAQLKAIMVRR
jgi:hypothetical protein